MLRAWLIERLGGYPDLDAAIAAIRDTEDVKRRNEILTLRVKQLFSTIGPNDLLREMSGGRWRYAGKLLTKEQVAAIREEAKVFKQMTLWKVLKGDLAYHSQSKVWKEAQDIPDLTAGKMLAYAADVIETRLDQMSSE